ncbi:hypothetical protein [Mycolicibacterium hodleri]|uniref:Uncharacterized protein n=1 Tax=Mycolicibacterium hodleri TaxID=49897 RepID=A0A502EFT8_9MYCO|nr:hypothetical protein [Mycolicibacterium hodleri]TPG35852.1 hypothetical protein EAH80_07350 [Mycolicibacterium hodleri]
MQRTNGDIAVNIHRRSFIVRSAAASTAMTVSQHLEMAVTRRAPSDFPVRVVEQLVGRRVPAGVARTTIGHLSQASLAAMAVMLADQTRHTSAAPAVVLISTSLVVADAVLGRILGLADAPWNWPPRDVSIELLHKTSLAVAARALSRATREIAQS